MEKKEVIEEAPLPDFCTFAPKTLRKRQKHLRRKKSLEMMTKNEKVGLVR